METARLEIHFGGLYKGIERFGPDIEADIKALARQLSDETGQGLEVRVYASRSNNPVNLLDPSMTFPSEEEVTHPAWEILKTYILKSARYL